MGVQVRQKGGKWYVFINHQGQRKAKCIGSDKRVAVQVQKQLEAKLALGGVGRLLDISTQLSATLAQPGQRGVA